MNRTRSRGAIRGTVFSIWGGITGRIFPIRFCFPDAPRRMLYMYRMTGTKEPERKRGTGMFEYRVEVYAVRKAEEGMNRMAILGWKVIAVTPNHAVGHGLVVTYERKRFA